MRRIVQQIAFVAAFFLLAAVTRPVAARYIVYVDDDAAPSGGGRSWTTAYRFLQDALTDAESSGEPVEVRVAQGLYKPDQSATTRKGSASGIETFYLFDELTLQGGYAGIAAPDPNARDVDAHATILSGDLEDNDLPIPAEVFRRDMPADRIDNVTHVVTVRGDVTIDGFTIRGGRYSIIPRGDSTGGAGMLLGGHEVKVANCTFRDNATTTGSGGAVYVGPVCHAEFVDCTFSNNYGSKGGTLYCRWGSVDLYGCEFTQNYSPSSGGAWGHRVVEYSRLPVSLSATPAVRPTGGRTGTAEPSLDKRERHWNSRIRRSSEIPRCLWAGQSSAMCIVPRSRAETRCLPETSQGYKAAPSRPAASA